MADLTTDTDQIERDLAQTRARMDRRLDELGDRLAPNQIVNDALSHVTGGDGADFAQTLIARAKANPLPAALTVAGIAWLMASSGKQDRARPAASDLPSRLRAAESGVLRIPDEHPEVHAGRLDDARGQVLGIARGHADTAASYAQRIREATAAATQTLREASHDLETGMARTVDQFGQQAHGGGLAAVARNPVALGAMAALAGTIAGALIPVGDKEERVLAGLAGQVRSKGRDLAQDVVERGSQVASDALDAARDSAEAHGLTPDKPVGELIGDLRSGDLVGHVKQAAQEVVGAGKDSLHAQLGDDPR